MNALVTGSSGWLGSALVEELLIGGYEVIAVTRSENNKLNNLKQQYCERLKIVKGDIRNYDILKAYICKVDEIYHLAAKVHSIPKTKVEEDEFYEINTKASERVFNLAVEFNVKRVIFYSTVAVYGESEEVININSKHKPVTPYAKSKLEAEKIAFKLYSEKKLPITIIEPVTVYGGEDRGNFAKLKALADKGLIIQFGDGKNKKTIIYYKDLIRATINIAKDDSTVGKVIICGSEIIEYDKINNVLSQSIDKKVFKIKINKKIIRIILKLLGFVDIGIFKKLRRNIFVLISSNIYDISSFKNYQKEVTSFENYYSRK